MIGVVARADEHDVAREFFELFKTPWQHRRSDGRYDVLVDTDHGTSVTQPAGLVLLYGSGSGAFDHQRERHPGPRRSPTMLSWRGDRIPVYGHCAPLPPDEGSPDLVIEDTQDPAMAVTHANGRTVVRIGYDLFAEIRFLLTNGQPPAHAGIPTLERHIAILRECIIRAGVPLVEIPPVPEGHRFMVCLTHDVDHPAIRLHRFDHTTLGFLYRAVLGSLVGACRGRTSRADLRRNLGAALTLPFVHLGWARDFWAGFDRYLDVERGLGSTFFVIPVKGDAGRTVEGRAPRLRASAYSLADIADQVRRIYAAGAEVGVHGIDAWLDRARGAEERAAVSHVTGAPTTGVRMHWLYFDQQAPERLEDAGFGYDSTFGYNETVGFRAGTLQAFKPLTAGQLLELPLHVMDTALFYPSRLGLAPAAARDVVLPLVDAAERHGGAFTVNWHDRSLAPERLWGGFYVDLIGELKRRAAWFPTAAQAVAWFRRRRAAVFDSARVDSASLRIAASADDRDEMPGLTVRVYTPIASDRARSPRSPYRATFADLPLRDTLDARVAV
jgi:hypothetical protein